MTNEHQAESCRRFDSVPSHTSDHERLWMRRFLPESLKIDGNVQTQTLPRGIMTRQYSATRGEEFTAED